MADEALADHAAERALVEIFGDTQNSFTAGILERRPSARRMPKGSEKTMPKAATITMNRSRKNMVFRSSRMASKSCLFMSIHVMAWTGGGRKVSRRRAISGA